jgi:alpha-2-macroglobulin
VLQRLGQGRLYYRLGTEWAEGSGSPPPREQGLVVERAVRTGPGGATITAGDAVAFDITLKNRMPLGYVAVEVPVPGGLEPVLDHLGRGHSASLLGSTDRATSHEERLPDRVRLFFDRLGPGEHQVTIDLRATTPGEYFLPPAHAEAMYMPEVYGRSAAGRITVAAPE